MVEIADVPSPLVYHVSVTNILGRDALEIHGARREYPISGNFSPECSYPDAHTRVLYGNDAHLSLY